MANIVNSLRPWSDCSGAVRARSCKNVSYAIVQPTEVQISLRIRYIQSFKILASFCSWGQAGLNLTWNLPLTCNGKKCVSSHQIFIKRADNLDRRKNPDKFIVRPDPTFKLQKFEPPHDKTNKMACLQCLHEESLGLKLPIESTLKTLIRLGRCPGWSESSLGAHGILMVLSWGGSILSSLIA